MEDDMKETPDVLSDEAVDGLLGDDLLSEDGLPDDLDVDDLGVAATDDEEEGVW
ncbi:MAG: hypothetical protein WC724_02495 [Candidatus Paceibacterota bacterium]|jgi:hypothetical protein